MARRVLLYVFVGLAGLLALPQTPGFSSPPGLPIQDSHTCEIAPEQAVSADAKPGDSFSQQLVLRFVKEWWSNVADLKYLFESNRFAEVESTCMPSPRYLEHPPQFMPSDPDFVLPATHSYSVRRNKAPLAPPKPIAEIELHVVIADVSPARPGNVFAGLVQDEHAFWKDFQTLNNENALKVLATPLLKCQSGRPASFLAGSEQAIPVPAGFGSVGIQFEEFGVRVNFVPRIMNNGKIYLEVEPEVSDLDDEAGTCIGSSPSPVRVTHHLHTSFEMNAGQTCVIGGVKHHSGKGSSEEETEVLVIVTPELPQAPPSEPASGARCEEIDWLTAEAARLNPDHPAARAARHLARRTSRTR